jgi:hypothetical protein
MMVDHDQMVEIDPPLIRVLPADRMCSCSCDVGVKRLVLGSAPAVAPLK